MCIADVDSHTRAKNTYARFHAPRELLNFGRGSCEQDRLYIYESERVCGRYGRVYDKEPIDFSRAAVLRKVIALGSARHAVASSLLFAHRSSPRGWILTPPQLIFFFFALTCDGPLVIFDGEGIIHLYTHVYIILCTLIRAVALLPDITDKGTIIGPIANIYGGEYDASFYNYRNCLLYKWVEFQVELFWVPILTYL